MLSLAYSVPIIKGGELYESQDRQILKDYKGNPLVEVSLSIPLHITYQAAPRTKKEGFENLQKISIDKRFDIFYDAGNTFEKEPLSHNGIDISPNEYDRLISLSTGLPISVSKRSREMASEVMRNMEHIVKIHTPDNDISLYDTGKLIKKGKNLSIVSPTNHPILITLSHEALALGYAIAHRPGIDLSLAAERQTISLYESGLPEHSLYTLPGTHDLVAPMMYHQNFDKTMLYGTKEVIEMFQPDISYGPGRSKIVVDDDYADDLKKVCDIVESSMMVDGGRGCINASAIIATKNLDEILHKLAERVSKYDVLDPLNPKAVIPAMKEKHMATWIDSSIDNMVKEGKLHKNYSTQIEDVTEHYREGLTRLVEMDGTQFILPTIIKCNTPTHPLFGNEYLFQFLTGVQVDKKDLVKTAENSLIVTALTTDKKLINDLKKEPTIEQVKTGKPTIDIDFKGPYKKTLVEHLFEIQP